MIAETIPQLRDMRLDDKIQLATELWDEILQHESQIGEPPNLAALLEQRLTDYRNGQMTGKPWEQVRLEIQGQHRR